MVPAGFDRAELVEISTGIKNVATSFKTTADWEKLATAASHMSASSVVLSAAPDVSPGVPGVGAAEIESEDEWLTGLQNYIKQGVYAILLSLHNIRMNCFICFVLSVCDLTPSLAPTAAVSSGSIASTASEVSLSLYLIAILGIYYGLRAVIDGSSEESAEFWGVRVGS